MIVYNHPVKGNVELQKYRERTILFWVGYSASNLVVPKIL